MLVAVLNNEKIKYGKEYRPNIQGCGDSWRNMVAREANNTAKGNDARRKHLNFELLDISSSSSRIRLFYVSWREWAR